MLTRSNKAPANSRQVGRKTGTRTGKKKDICTGRRAGIQRGTQTGRQTGTQETGIRFQKICGKKRNKKVLPYFKGNI